MINLSGPLEHVSASYDDPAVWSRPTRTTTIAQRADQLAAYVDLSLDEPQAVQSLRDATAELRDAPGLTAALPKVLAGAMSLMGTEVGNIQLLDPGRDSLVLVTQFGFGPEFLDHFAVVDDDRSVCGRAASHCAQAVVADVRDDPAFTPHRKVFRTAGVRAVQSTPLVDKAGRMMGMISTHLPHPGRPPERDLRLMALYGQFAGEVIARHLGAPSRSDTAPAPAEPAAVPLLTETVRQIFGAGLSFASARSLVVNGDAARRLRDGVAKLDDAVRTIHRAMVGLDGVGAPEPADALRDWVNR
ncbi:GAF domain-containing protein [Allokutzneria albata]|uniref:GAF domain-containing protein n=1 Tax=Allokutzneria albata TaxID=211114 RepID=UPI00138E4210|nr:GAF domain-containing protein [Allokutzneria albata]